MSRDRRGHKGGRPKELKKPERKGRKAARETRHKRIEETRKDGAKVRDG